MRTETLWQGERRAARMHWWRQVVDRPVTANCDDTFDEILRRRFGSPLDLDVMLGGETPAAAI